jgi:hypothetical protein
MRSCSINLKQVHRSSHGCAVASTSQQVPGSSRKIGTPQ